MSVTHTFPWRWWKPAVPECAPGRAGQSLLSAFTTAARACSPSPPSLRSGGAQRVQNHASKEMGVLDYAQVPCRVS